MNILDPFFMELRAPDPDPENAPSGGDPSPTPTGDDPTPSPTPSGDDPSPAPADSPAAAPAGDDPSPAPGTPSWIASAPENWREELAGDDEARLNDLGRYPTLSDWVNSGFEAKNRIRKGEISTGLPENPTEEQLAEYRQANGIPEAPDGYEMKLPQGIEAGENDGELYDAVAPVAHKLNLSADAYNTLVAGMIEARNGIIQRMIDQDGLDKINAERTLRGEWGADYVRNMNATTNLINGLPEAVRQDFIEGRDGNGRSIMSNPAIVQWLADISLKANPGVRIPGGGEDATGAADAIISKVKQIFNEGNEAKEYYGNPELMRQYEDALAIKMQFQNPQGANQ